MEKRTKLRLAAYMTAGAFVLGCGLPTGKITVHNETPGENGRARQRKVCVQADDRAKVNKEQPTGYVKDSDGVVCTTDVTGKMWDNCQVGERYPDCQDDNDPLPRLMRGKVAVRW